MVIGYYKYRLKEFILQMMLQYKYRKKLVYIGKGCILHKSVRLNENITIKDNCNISEDVILHKGVSIGSYSNLSRIEININSTIESGVKCTGYGEGKIIIGKECYIGVNNILDWSDNIIIGDFVHIAGPSTGLWTHSSAMQCHNGLNLDNKAREFRHTESIVIEDNVYIGGNCTIYPGITIGHHSIIAPNSAVDKDVEPYALVGGVPAKLIKKLDIKES